MNGKNSTLMLAHDGNSPPISTMVSFSLVGMVVPSKNKIEGVSIVSISSILSISTSVVVSTTLDVPKDHVAHVIVGVTTIPNMIIEANYPMVVFSTSPPSHIVPFTPTIDENVVSFITIFFSPPGEPTTIGFSPPRELFVLVGTFSSSSNKPISDGSNRSMDLMTSHAVITKAEDGWIIVKGKHPKNPSPSFDMTLRSHMHGSKGKL